MEHREQAEKYLRKQFNAIIFKRKVLDNYVEKLMNNHNLSISLTMDYINDRIHISTIDEEIIFILIETFDIINNTKYIENYFNKDEIKIYKEYKYIVETFKFPLVIPCVPVTSDQWIGAVDAKFYMELRKAQLIRYNTEAQRVMRPLRNRKDGIETFRIAVNKKSIQEIKEQMKAGTYIPDEITLNIPDGVDCEMNYINGELIIEKIDHFDISDGYHRYLAMGELFDEDEEFNYPMELRIINYSLTKVKRFIHQKDQKTKMSKVDSDSMNMDSFANIISEQLNTAYGNGIFILHGKINRNDGIIRLPELAKIIEYFYGKDGIRKKKYTMKEMSSLREEIKDGLNKFFIDIYPEDVEELNKRIDYIDLLLGMYIIKNDLFTQYNNDTLKNKFVEASKVMHNNDNKKIFMTHTPKAKQINLIKELL